jgi:tol-pal system protein YbgF
MDQAQLAGLRIAVRTSSAANNRQLIEMKRPSVFPVAALFVLLLLSGCAGKGAASWKQERTQVMESLQQAEGEQAAVKVTLDQMKERIARLEQSLNEQLKLNNELSARLNTMQKSRGSSKKAAPRVGSRNQKQLTKKLKKIESNIHSATRKSSSSMLATNPENEKNAYTSAYLALKSGRYDEASQAFKTLLLKYPEGEYADQALYWLGESYFAQKKMKKAIKAFKGVANNYPNSAKHSAALLKLASAYQTSGHKGDTKAVLQRLIKQHPESNAAGQARSRLKIIEAGH